MKRLTLQQLESELIDLKDQIKYYKLTLSYTDLIDLLDKVISAIED